jgi:hypothetical protein
MEMTDQRVENITYRAMIAALVLYLLCSPLSTYNTLAMFGLVESKWVAVQLSITAVMILLATIAGTKLSRLCVALVEGPRRTLWLVSFWVIGPPALYAFYHLRLRTRS